MKEIVLKVGPAATGWSVDCDVLQPTFFQSGARAESVARRLAIELSGAGHDVRVLVEDRAERLIATHRYFGG
jgi:hypothetical protein